jgi:hypothetical protein
VNWHRGQTGDPVVGFSAVQWFVPAISEAVRGLRQPLGTQHWVGFAPLSDAVWTVTMVDAALVRYHPATYDQALLDQSATERRLIEQSLAGLRFVRNRIAGRTAVADLIEPNERDVDEPSSAVIDWTWRPVVAPTATELQTEPWTWELARYEAYQTRLAGQAVGEVFERAEAFLHRTAAMAQVLPGAAAAAGARTTTSPR